ncbi:MAG: hypothetical protein Fur0041_21500 [Bacteroidia bacterium]
MQEFFFTVLAIWVIWRLFSAFSESSSSQRSGPMIYYNQHHHYHNKEKEGEVNISQKAQQSSPKKSDNDGEYVDYEEIP